MAVIEIEGDLLDSDCDVIAHGCNCFHTMGSGIARQIRLKWPEVYEADLKSKYGDKDKLGTYTVATITTKPKTIKRVYNLYTQWAFGGNQVHADYFAIFTSLAALKKAEPGLKIGIPRIGCGLAGGNWETVYKILTQIFHDHDIYVYTL